MFIGHYAAGLALRKAESRLPLWWLILAACWLDVLFGIFLVAGIERVRIVPGFTAANALDLYDYPFSHSLTAALIWTGLAYLLFRFVPLHRHLRQPKVALLMAVAVFSHWLLDWISHSPDLPLGWGESPKFGLGLWNSIPATLLVESLLFIAGFYLYMRSTPSRSLRGNPGISILAVVLLIINYVSTGGEPPPSPEMIGYVNLIGGAVIIGLFAWLGKTHRKEKDPHVLS